MRSCVLSLCAGTAAQYTCNVSLLFIVYPFRLNPVSVDLRFEQITLDIQPYLKKIPTKPIILSEVQKS